MAYLRGFRHGVVTGLVVGVLVAPRSGADSRRQLAGAYRRGRRTAEDAMGRAQTGWASAQPAVAAAVGVARRTAKMAAPALRGASGPVGQIVGRRQTSEPFFAPAEQPSGDGQ